MIPAAFNVEPQRSGHDQENNLEADERNVKYLDVTPSTLANPLDRFQIGVKKLIEDLMIQRLSENDDIVTRYMEDGTFQNTAFPILAREIFEAINTAAGRKNVDQIIADGEGDAIEFKSTLRMNLHTSQFDVKMEHSVLKTIAAFLNSREGGTLIIGVNDNREAVGIKTDKFSNEDKMNLHLINLIKQRLGTTSMLNIKPHFEDFKDKRILVVDCTPSSSPIYIKDGRTEEFYIRAGASTAALAPSEMNEFIRQRFRN